MHDSVDPADTAPDAAPGELTIEVDGHEAAYTATTDLDGDGHDDSVYVSAHDGPDGVTDGGYAYTDTDGDGSADTLSEFDARGEVVAQAVLDPDGGDWHEVAAGSVDVTGAAAGGDVPVAGTITVDAPQGPEVAGVASYDTDGDGVVDTAVASTVDGTTLLVTDVDGDGAADLVTEVSADGTYSSFEHTGEGEWTEVDSGSLADGGTGPGPVTTDPGTGEWTSA
ncbi:hypothetical protein RHODO2019_17330 [Rhodococcus antarcticus]|uniref:DUF6802 domain-containing protein n=1 Tax=Rhodococcus antarcticus TaxID=2987751 RepID=A0ABY6NZJ4_9NOCA|nr:DUF6802 family protein [Rhodococcus antarcticus]UZJ24837.1 hypothetical protein RHODO2019_17330 [Rhodococcus antarcticus]